MSLYLCSKCKHCTFFAVLLYVYICACFHESGEINNCLSALIFIFCLCIVTIIPLIIVFEHLFISTTDFAPFGRQRLLFKIWTYSKHVRVA